VHGARARARMRGQAATLLLPLLAVLLLALGGLGAYDPALELLHARLLSGRALPPALAPPLLPLAPCPRALTLVVLGYALAADGSASPALAGRVAAAADAYAACAAQGAAAALVFSGGVPRGRAAAEAHVMQALALQRLNLSHAPASWLLEAASASTLENAALSLRLLARAGAPGAGGGGGGGVLAVATSPFHQLRAFHTFRCQLAAAAAAAATPASQQPLLAVLPVGRAPPASPGQRAERAAEALREALALAYYLALGRLQC
jgi:hypothetical protein